MLRGAILAGVVSAFAVSPALAQSEFDATGQFTLSFKFGLPGGKKEPPKVGFRLGASNVPTSQLDAADPLRRQLNLDFDRRDFTSQTFSGVGFEFGEADKQFRFLEDPFSANSLGLTQDRASGGFGGTSNTDFSGTDSRQDRQDWLLGSEDGTGWTVPPGTQQ